jgi:indolepyruvate ferredoxin oxidoreductase alpha subunit
MVIEGFKLSEKFNTPVLIRVTTRVCHSKSVVECFDRKEIELKKFENNQRFLCLPSVARKLHVQVEKRSLDIAEYGNSYKWNKAEYNDTSIGIITSGISYNYAREVFPEASVLKLTLSWPMPEKLIREFAAKVDRIIVIEENEPFIEDQVKAMGITCEGKKYFSLLGELSPEVVQEGLAAALPKRVSKPEFVTIPEGVEPAVRPPVLCPGCPHRGTFRALGKLKVFVSGDIGCYTLGAFAPLSALHSCLCMGGGVTVAEGIEKARGNHDKVVGMVGDSTFVHSGITGLIDMVYNKSKGTLIIVDNSITAMTGHQQNPTTGKTLRMEDTAKLDIEAMCRACGVKHVRVVDPYDLKATEDVLKEEINRGELSVVITRRPCILILKDRIPETFLSWDSEACKACGMCLKIGCPAMEKQADNDKQPKINMSLCVHCGMCAQMCKFNALTMNRKED